MDILETIPKNGLKFDFRGSPIDPELRPLWRVSLIVLILKELCSGGKANAKKMQALYSLVASEKKRSDYLNNVRGDGAALLINIRFDPLVDRAVDIGVGKRILWLDEAKSIKLTDSGLAYANRIIVEKDIFMPEKAFIGHFSKSHFSDKTINKLISGGLV